MKYNLTNREKSRQAARTRFYCYHCDAQYVAEGEKCLRCGIKDNHHKKRKLKNFAVDS